MINLRVLSHILLIVNVLVVMTSITKPIRAAPKAAIVVNTLEDEFNADGDCSLREAMAAANFNTPIDTCPGGDSSATDTITFSLSGTIVLGFYLPPVKNAGALVIDGGGNIIISGNNSVRVFYIEQEANLVLKNLTVSSGYVFDENGAGIYNDGGNITIQNCTFEYNNAAGDSSWGGGAIFSTYGPGSNLTISKSTFYMNQARLSGGAILYSGGEKYTIHDSVFHWNQSVFGGAIYSSMHLDIHNTTFEHNRASGSAGSTAYGGALYLDFADVQIYESTFSQNSADAGGGIKAVMSQVNMDHSSMSNNQATFSGGAIHTGNLSDLALSHVSFDDNSAGNEGGALSVTQSHDSSIKDCSFTTNSAGEGGAIRGDLLNGSIQNSTFYNNSALKGGAFYGFSSVGPDYSDLQLTNNTISGNIAGWGGGVYISDSKLTLTNNTFHENHATNSGNNLYNDSSMAGVLTVQNSIVADDGTGSNCIGTITDGGHNIDSGATCTFDPAKGSQNNTDPHLDGLKDNGGSTLTHALLGNSPAINAADPALCPSSDQRGEPRRTGFCDSGAYEAQAAALTAVSGSGQNTVILSDFPDPLVTEAKDAVGNSLGGVQILFTGPGSGAGISNSGGSLTTGINGRVSFKVTANAIIGGPYSVSATSDGLSTSYSLTNLGYPTTTIITDDSPDPSEAGQIFNVKFQVTASQGTPSGSITVSVSGRTENCSAILTNGGGNCSLNIPSPGTFTLKATYSGDDSFASSSTNATHTVIQKKPEDLSIYLPLMVR